MAATSFPKKRGPPGAAKQRQHPPNIGFPKTVLTSLSFRSIYIKKKARKAVTAVVTAVHQDIINHISTATQQAHDKNHSQAQRPPWHTAPGRAVLGGDRLGNHEKRKQTGQNGITRLAWDLVSIFKIFTEWWLGWKEI